MFDLLCVMFIIIFLAGLMSIIETGRDVFIEYKKHRSPEEQFSGVDLERFASMFGITRKFFPEKPKYKRGSYFYSDGSKHSLIGYYESDKAMRKRIKDKLNWKDKHAN